MPAESLAKNSLSKSLTEKVSCQLEVLTPVHIGTPHTWNEGADFVQKNGKVYIVDVEKYFDLLQNTQGAGANNGMDELMNLIGKGKSGDIGELCNLLGIDPADFALQTFHPDQAPYDPIRPLIRTGAGIPYLPGSSIKGAIRSVLFNYMYNLNNRPEYNRFTESDLIGVFEKAITRYIRPFDVEILGEQTSLANLRTFNLYLLGFPPQSDYKQNLPMTVEHFKPGATGNFRFAVDEQWVEKLSGDLRSFLPKNIRHFIKPGQAAIPHLFNLINEYTLAHLRREIEFLVAYPQAEDTEHIIENLENLRRLAANNADSCVLRLGFGGGYHSITGDWRFSDHTSTIEKPDFVNKRRSEPLRYKTRKVAGKDLDAALMGFVKITLPAGYERIKFQERPLIPVATPKVVVRKPGDNTSRRGGESPKNTPNTVPAPKIELQTVTPQPVKFSEIDSQPFIFAKVIKIGKPHCEVELLLEGSPFENSTASMSGAKGVSLEEGQFVKVTVNSKSKEGKINTVVLLKY